MIFDEEKELLWQEHCNYHSNYDSPEAEKTEQTIGGLENHL